jgi:hypothetical protein
MVKVQKTIINVKEYCFRMVRTRQEARADSSPVRDERLVETGDRGLERDPLVDIASFVPVGSVQSGQGESSGLRDERGIFDGDG